MKIDLIGFHSTIGVVFSAAKVSVRLCFSLLFVVIDGDSDNPDGCVPHIIAASFPRVTVFTMGFDSVTHRCKLNYYRAA